MPARPIKVWGFAPCPGLDSRYDGGEGLRPMPRQRYKSFRRGKGSSAAAGELSAEG